ncbi:MAG: 50S ribosomal protein L18e [Desulfurococcales archaeon]|nr:50S ribosomal protein L18e [Desulfurococcales archaeon]
MRRTGPTSILTRKLIVRLRKKARDTGAAAWLRVAELLEKPTRTRPAVNLSKINRHAVEGEMILVPGKVLGSGILEKKVTIAALGFSEKALLKIKASGSRAITLEAAMDENPTAKRTRIII